MKFVILEECVGGVVNSIFESKLKPIIIVSTCIIEN